MPRLLMIILCCLVCVRNVYAEDYQPGKWLTYSTNDNTYSLTIPGAFMPAKKSGREGAMSFRNVSATAIFETQSISKALMSRRYTLKQYNKFIVNNFLNYFKPATVLSEKPIRLDNLPGIAVSIRQIVHPLGLRNTVRQKTVLQIVLEAPHYFYVISFAGIDPYYNNHQALVLRTLNSFKRHSLSVSTVPNRSAQGLLQQPARSR